MNINKSNFEEGNLIPEPDEGWWAAILADEVAIASERTEINCKPCHQTTANGVTDWDCVRKIFLQDEVVLLEVYGYNRGGLLVKGDGIQGFVPVSHLVDLPIESNEETKQVLLSKYEGRSLYLKVIECEPSSERV
ncbi:MAG: hypothetical protein HGB14_12845, partial [Anaerolineaceae bacterium]|nr:hypothetical protein [Anaerolineaceae bacterium]